MTWSDLRTKFDGLVEPVLGVQKTAVLHDLLKDFERPGSLQKTMTLLAGPSSSHGAVGSPINLQTIKSEA